MSKSETIAVPRKTVEDVIAVLDQILKVAKGDKK